MAGNPIWMTGRQTTCTLAAGHADSATDSTTFSACMAGWCSCAFNTFAGWEWRCVAHDACWIPADLVVHHGSRQPSVASGWSPLAAGKAASGMRTATLCKVELETCSYAAYHCDTRYRQARAICHKPVLLAGYGKPVNIKGQDHDDENCARNDGKPRCDAVGHTGFRTVACGT